MPQTFCVFRTGLHSVAKKCGILLLLIQGCSHYEPNKLELPPTSPPSGRKANCILVIGDGMALSQVSHSVIQRNNQTWFDHFQVVGFHKATAFDDLITDSAAGATAFACGKKTHNGRIGMDSDGKPAPTLVEILENKGYATGIVTTCSATHATPAAFVAHQMSRAYTEEIALDFKNTTLDCLIAGGKSSFEHRFDRIEILDTLRARGYTMLQEHQLSKIPEQEAPFFCFMAVGEPLSAVQGRNYLPQASKLAAEYLNKRCENGFFLMVEGSQIDWALHGNNKQMLTAEMLDFEKTLEQILDFAAKDGNTTVIVTGDHECGGLSINPPSAWGKSNAVFATNMHTGSLVPVFAFGPDAHLFSGIYDNTAIFTKINKIYE